MKAKKSNEKILLVAQEIAFAKALAANDKSLRERALRKLNKWLKSRSKSEGSFTEETFMRLWKGLFYFVYMSDKPLVQESGIESISNLIHCFKNFDDTRKFVRCFFQSMSQAWFGLDGHRMDKYLMLVRRFLRQIFENLRKTGWASVKVIDASEDLTTALSMAPLGLNLHITEIYLEELAKVSRGALKPSLVLELIRPFGELMHLSNDSRLLRYIKNYVFLYLLQQSEQGIKHEMKFQAWRERGFPGGRIDVLEEVEDDGDEDDETGDEEMEESEPTLDPRAGRVDVLLPPIDFEPKPIAEYLASLKKRKETTNPARKLISVINNSYNSYNCGKYPLGIHKIGKIKEGDVDSEIDEAVLRLVQTDKELYEASQVEPPENARKKKKNTKKSRLMSVDWVVSALSEDYNFTNSSRESTKGTWEVTENKFEDTTSLPMVNGSTSSVEKINKRKKTDKTSAKKKAKLVEEGSKDWGSAEWDSPSANVDTKTRPQASDFFYTPTVKTKENALKVSGLTPPNGKKVEFVLNRNTAQDEKEYKMSLKKRPSVPYDADKKPSQSALKVTPVNSPINPFFRLRDSFTV